jgi:hypothetical protein
MSPGKVAGYAVKSVRQTDLPRTGTDTGLREMTGRSIKWRVSSSTAIRDEIDGRARAAGMGRSEYVVTCCLGGDVPAPVRTSLPPSQDEFAFLQRLMFDLEECVVQLRWLRREVGRTLRKIATARTQAAAPAGSCRAENAGRVLELLRSNMERIGDLTEEILGRV